MRQRDRGREAERQRRRDTERQRDREQREERGRAPPHLPQPPVMEEGEGEERARAAPMARCSALSEEPLLLCGKRASGEVFSTRSSSAPTLWSQTSGISHSSLFSRDSVSSLCPLCVVEQERGVLHCSLCLRQLYKERQLSLVWQQQETEDVPPRGAHLYRVTIMRVAEGRAEVFGKGETLAEELLTWKVLEVRIFMSTRSNLIVLIVKWASYADFEYAFQKGELHRIFGSFAYALSGPPNVLGTGPPRWQYETDPVIAAPHLREWPLHTSAERRPHGP
eukprot:scaffold95944_cov33-Tisochrysis_lutea.AAC.6